MKDYFIDIDMHAVWKKLPVYRIWVNNELMCERTFWPNPETYVIRERLTLGLEPGEYKLTIEQVDPSLGKVWAKHIQIIDVDEDRMIQDHVPGDLDENKQVLTFTV